MQILKASSKINEMSPSEPAISVSNLNHYFGKIGLRKQALFDINLDN
jgi:putative ABC transport system ATP-binding protein